jgi:hypothetical protein
MPYADPSEQKEYHRTLFLLRYQSDPEFREAESFRKKRWYTRNRAKIVAALRRKRKILRVQKAEYRKAEKLLAGVS